MSPKVITLEDIFECLKDQKKEISEGKRETNEKIEKFMGVIENNIQEVRKDVNVLNVIMEERERENLKRHKETEIRLLENEKRNKEEANEMSNRMSKLEDAMKRTNFSRMKNTELKQMRKNDDPKSLPVSTEKISPEKSKNSKKNESPPRIERRNSGSSSGWSKNLDEELSDAAELAKKIEKRTNKPSEEVKRNENVNVKSNGMKALKKWFAQESPEGSEVSEESGSSEDENEAEYINRKQRNKVRRQRNLENKEI